MMIYDEPDLAEVIYEYAGSKPEKWEDLIGWPILHKVYGAGKLTRVDNTQNGINLFITFDKLSSGETEKRFLPSAFKQGYFTIEYLPDSLEGIQAARDRVISQMQAANAEEERQRKIELNKLQRLEEKRKQEQAEEESATEFLELQKLYGVKSYQKDSPSSPLYLVLLKLRSGECFSEGDCDWLESEHLYNLLAKYYEHRYLIDGDLWNVARAGKYWRKAQLPENVLKIKCDLSSGDSRACAAVLTNRGAAMRDRGRLSDALKLANAALKQESNNYHAYNLLGAIYFQNGDLEQGEDCFAKALELGATPLSQEEAMKTAIRLNKENDRKRTAQYLVSKDPIKYAWAKYYLK